MHLPLHVIFLNETATTKSYKYAHTLSLHDALPISAGQRRQPVARPLAGFRPQHPLDPPRHLGGGAAREGHQQDPPGIRTRSDEHTSELQSLMRISYAVFSLTNKTYIHHIPTPPTHTKLSTTQPNSLPYIILN